MKNRSHHTKTGAMWPAHDKLQNRLARVVSVIPLCLKGVFAWSAHRIILLLGLLLTVSAAQAQTSMVKWSFPFSNTPTSNIPVNAGKLVTVAGAAGAMATGGGFTSDPVYSSPNGWNNGAGNSWWLINFSTTNHTGISIKFNLGTYQFGPKDFKMQYSTSSASGPWTDQGFTVGFGVVPSHVMNSYTESLPAACDNKTNVWVRFVTTSATATGGGAVIDEVEILGTSLAVPWYQDTDADGWGNTGVSQTSVTQPSGYVLNSLDCNDGAVHSTTWSNVGSAGISGGSVDNTSIAIDGNGTPYVAFRDMSTSGGVSVMKFSGSSWISVGSAAFSSSYALYPSIAIDKNGTPYVVYRDGGNSDKATVMKYNGSSWVNV